MKMRFAQPSSFPLILSLLVVSSSLHAQGRPKCRFEPEYQRIKSDKTDPRVAYIETYAKLHAQEAKDAENSDWNPFVEACKEVAHQSTAATSFFDAAHKYFQVYTTEGGNVYSESVTYFAGARGHEGLILRSQDDADQFSASAFIFRNGKWEDVSAQYLAPLKLAKADFIIVPQYGRAARVIHFDQQTVSFHPKGWLLWNGEKFEWSAAKTVPGWRCPDTSSKFFTADFFGPEAPPELRTHFCR